MKIGTAARIVLAAALLALGSAAFAQPGDLEDDQL